MLTSYEKAIGKQPTPQEPEQEEDAGKVNSRLAWLSSERTQEVFKELLNDSNTLVADAMGLALINHQQDNSKQIVLKLVQADCLRKVVNKYASRK